MRRAFVTGITGQDGSYLTELLLLKGYRVFGGYRRSSSQSFWRLAALGILDHEHLSLVEHDLTDLGSNIRALSIAEPDEVYNLAAQSFVAVSFKEPTTTAQISAVGALQLLEAVKIVNPAIRFYQASSAEMYGKVQAIPQDEQTPFYPRSPYAISKLFGHWTAVNYREAYGMFVSSGILFNHESPLRGPEFVTRKISQAAARIKLGQQSVLELGNLGASRDWGYAKEYVEGMWRMLQAEKPDTFVLATGKTATVREFATLSFKIAGIPLVWSGSGSDEVGHCSSTGRAIITVSPALKRPAEVEHLVGNSAKAQRILDWQATFRLEDLCALMVRADLAQLTSH
jgi:GDPmannose 4,6-dehydratase